MLGFRPKRVTPEMVRRRHRNFSSSQNSPSHSLRSIVSRSCSRTSQRMVLQDKFATPKQLTVSVSSSPNVHYDLLRTGNVELTTNKILERGFLESVSAIVVARKLALIQRPSLECQPPGAFHTLYPSTQTQNGAQASRANSQANAAATKPTATKTPSLIERYNLEQRVQTGEVVAEETVGGKAHWEDSPEKREASLKERKAQMILAARQ